MDAGRWDTEGLNTLLRLGCGAVVLIAALFAGALCYVAWDLKHGTGGLSAGRPDDFTTTAPLKDFEEYPVYWLGEEYKGHQLVYIDIEYDDTRPSPEIVLLYGQCELPRLEGGCSPPAQVTLMPTCETLNQPFQESYDEFGRGWTYAVYVRFSGIAERQDLRLANPDHFPDLPLETSTAFIDDARAWCGALDGTGDTTLIPRAPVTAEQRLAVTAFDSFPLYWFAESIATNQLVAVELDARGGARFLYGSCREPLWADYCGPPEFRIEVRPACSQDVTGYPSLPLTEAMQEIYMAPGVEGTTLWTKGAVAIEVNARLQPFNTQEIVEQLRLANPEKAPASPVIARASSVGDALRAFCSGG